MHSARSVCEVLAAEKRNFNAVVKGNGGGYARMDVSIPQHIPDPLARPEAG
jgi:hypothetical protein